MGEGEKGCFFPFHRISLPRLSPQMRSRALYVGRSSIWQSTAL